ncbi:hypothetical protein GCM10009087_06360 [Sphingomonas oligophenolica]|uniref:DUF4349 domain-containing protein n=1 Tax=Sphingomonas oligophenolica TaxID=301154 RepID=A0ABU9XX48_9SPHN
MRVVAVMAALLMLAGCDQAPGQADGSGARAEPASSESPPAFDYRYAFRLPSAQILAVQESHAKGCDQLGPARCRITAVRYHRADDQNHVSATLTLRLDPTLARAYGRAATATVTGAGGALTNAELAGRDSVAAMGRSDTVLARLRDAVGNIEAQLHGTVTTDQRLQLTARADRLRAAMATINELDQNAGATAATTPVILTYESGGPVAGALGSSDATFDTAGATLMSSLAGLATVLAGVGPWLLLLLGGALILRRIVQGDPDRTPAPELPPAPAESEGRNVIQRWFSRDEHHETEPAQ